MHLSVPKKNWHAIYTSPHKRPHIANWYTRIRYAACLAMSFLAKKNRVDVVLNRIIMYSITRVLEVIRMGRWQEREWVWAVSYRKDFVVGSRLCALKMMVYLSKNRDVIVALARGRSSLRCWWILPIRWNWQRLYCICVLCVATLTNLARHPENADHLLVCNLKGLVPMFLLLFVLLRDCRIIARLSAICTAFWLFWSINNT